MLIFFPLWMVLCFSGRPADSEHGRLKDRSEIYFSFAKTYGYIKYFYPGDAAATIDWDRFAYYGVRSIDKNESADVSIQLSNLFRPLVPELVIQRNRPLNEFQTPERHERPVYWQHLGDGKGSVGHPYKSMRINRPANVLPESSNDFGTMSRSLPVDLVRGKTIRMKAAIVADPLFAGTPSIIILVKEKGKDSKMISSSGQAVSSEKWLVHTVTATIPDSIEKTTIILQSITLTGAVRFDDVSWEFLDAGKWVTGEEFDFNTMSQEECASLWKLTAPLQEIILTDEAGERSVSFRRMTGVAKEIGPLFNKGTPNKEWIAKPIGSGLYASFPMVLWPKDDVPPPGFDLLVKEINAISPQHLSADHLYTRLANVILLWNKIQHFHPDNPMSQAEWEAKLRQAIRRSFSDKTADEHRLTLTQMIAPLNDSHTTLYYASILRQDFYLPFTWEFIENNLVITQVFETGSQLNPGDVVTHVDGMTTERYWELSLRSVTGATASRRKYKALEEALKGRKGSSVRIKTKDDKEIIAERKLPAFEFNKWVRESRDLQSYQQLEAGVFYIDLTTISWKDLQSHIDELAAAKKIIFDLRGYPGWQTIEIVSHFIKNDIRRLSYGIPRITLPDREGMTFSYDSVIMIRPRYPFISAKKVFLTNGKAISYAEDFLNLISYYQLADIVGEPTAGTTGTVNMCYLFGGLSTPWTGMRVLRQDGKLFNGKGIIPTYMVKGTVQAVKEGRDEYIEQALLPGVGK